VFEACLARGTEVAGVFCAPEKQGARADALRRAAEERGVRVHQFASLRSEEARSALKALDADIGIMAFVLQFAPQDFVGIPRHGTIQYHPSLLPKYRGPSSINWPIIHGDTQTGLTIFRPTDGLDEGPVILQRVTPIGPDDTLASVYFDRLFPMGVEAMLEGVDLVKAGKAPKIKQDHSKATYEGLCRPENAKIDWGKPWEQIDRLIRGCNPAPGAWTVLDGKQVRIFDAKPLPARDPKGIGGKLGEIVAVEADGITVVCADGRFKVTRVQPPEGKKIDAGEWAKSANLAKGARFTSV
jgi:methionyl-tRNA formyltransferase